MKKQFIFLMICAAVVFAIAQSPQLMPYGAKGKYFQVVGSNGDSVQLGNGKRKAIKDIKTDTLSLSHRIDAKLAIVDTANKWLPKSTPFATVARTGSYDDLTNKPTIPSAQVNADWNASTGIAQILNKPVAMPASDVYDWAKAATKPTYAYSEITNTPSVITPSDTSVFVRKAGTQTITGQKTFSGGLVANGVESSAGGLFYGQWTPFPTGLGTYVANYVSPTYGARILAYNGTAYQDLKLGKLMSGSNFQLHLNADGTSVFNGALTASNLLGTNTGDETLSSIKSKLGAASASNDGYLSRDNWSTFNNKQDALGYTPVNSAAVGAANGVAPLDASAKIPTAYLPEAIVGSVKYKGSLNASGGSYPSSPSKGDYYVISTPGTIGTVTYTNGDWAVYNGTTWDAILQGHYVTSVFGRTGAVSAVAGDYTTDQVTEGVKKYYSDALARSALSLTTTGNSGPATYNSSTGAWNMPNYTLAGLGGQSQLNGTGFVKASGTTISYDNNSYSLSSHNHSGVYEPVITAGTTAQYWRGDKTWQAMPTSLPASDVYAWAKAASKPSYTASEVGAQSTLSGTGIVKSTSGTISYLTDNSDAWNTAVSWGNHALAGYAKYDGTGATGTWPISVSGTAASATSWANAGTFANGYPSSLLALMALDQSDSKWHVVDNTRVQSWLELNNNSTLSNSISGTSYGVRLNYIGMLGSIGALKSALITQMNGAGRNIGSSISFNGYLDGIMANWTNDSYTFTNSSETTLFRLDNYGTSTYGTWLAVSYRNNDIYQIGRDGNTWTSVYKLLTTGNYASYGAKIDGTNASGTWPISITGTATNWSGSSSLGTLAYQSPSGSAAGKVLTATDGSNNCTWQTPTVAAKNITTNVYTITGSVTLNPTDFTSNSIIYVNSSSAVTITLPANNLDEWWPLGNSIAICRMGTGTVTFAVGSFGSLSSMNSYRSIADVEGWVSLTHRGTISGEFHLVGDLSN